MQVVLKYSDDGQPGSIQLLRIDESWVEGTGDVAQVPGVTWTLRDTQLLWAMPGGTATASLASTPALGPDPGPLEIELPVLEVQRWIDMPGTNHGMLWMSPDGGHWHPIARDGDPTTDRPQLRLVLQDP